MIYFIEAVGVGVIKIGHSKAPSNRLSSMSVWSPVPLKVAAIDTKGDWLTESELLWRFRKFRSHGEWFFTSPELLHALTVTAKTGRAPGAWYLPSGYGRSTYKALSPGGPTAAELKSTFGLSVADIRRVSGYPNALCGLGGTPLRHIPAIVEHLREQDHRITYLDVLATAKRYHLRQAAA